MKKSLIYSFIASAILIGFANLPLHAQDQTVSGNLTVTGTSDLEGNTLNIGSWSGTTSEPGMALIYVDGTTAGANFIANRTTAIWQWWTNNGSANVLSMKLDQNNQLILYSGTVAAITLSPSGTSAFAGNITIGGTDNELPNQTLLNSSSILTEGLGDARYVRNGTTIVISSGNVGIGTATPQNGLDVSGAVEIGADYAGVNTAPSNGLLVEGNVGIGTTTPAHALDVAGDGAFSGSLASGLLQTNGSEAVDVSGLGGTYSQGFVGHVTGGGGFDGNGFAFTNSNLGSSVLGMVVNGDTMFIGNAVNNTIYATIDQAGTYSYAAQGTLSIGAVIASGTTTMGALIVSGTSPNPNKISNGGLVVTGSAVTSGTTTTYVSTGTNQLILIPQQGDLLMGGFTAGATPQ